MGGILLVLMLAPVLWAIMWFITWLSYRLSKWSPWRAVAGIFFVISYFGMIVLQFHLLAVFESDSFARSHSLYVIFPDCIPGIALMFYTAIREDKAKKQRETASSESLTNREHNKLSASPSASLKNTAQHIEIVNVNGFLKAVIPPSQNKYLYHLVILILAIGMVGILGIQFVLMHPHPHTSIGLMRFNQALTVLAVGYLLALAFTGRNTLTLDPKCLKIESSVLSLTVSKKSFANPNVINLRYAQWQINSQNRTIERSGIRFEVGSKTYTFGSSVAASQAHELLNSMRSIYSFPERKEEHA